MSGREAQIAYRAGAEENRRESNAGADLQLS